MKVDRSATQILHGFLPNQTVDLQGGVWKVSRWRHPRVIRVDADALRRELIRLAGPWELSGADRHFVRDLRANGSIRVLGLDLANGVMVDRFPEAWQCRVCNRIARSRSGDCRCGAHRWGQLHFVGYHECGALAEPYIPRCKTHDDVKAVFPGSSDASQIRFVCPVCQKLLRQGFGFLPCECGRGTLRFNVHRAAAVFTPRSFAVVNASSPERAKDLRSASGLERALSWVISGMPVGGLGSVLTDRTSLIDDLISKGFDRSTAEKMAAIAVQEGDVTDDDTASEIGNNYKLALDGAATIVNAVSEARSTVDDLVAGTTAGSLLGDLYRGPYLRRLESSGLSSVELIERFPVLVGNFGFTRGDPSPGESRLVTWRDPETRGRVVYADLQETEALFFRLDPIRVTAWLHQRGHMLPAAEDAKGARLAVLRHAFVPPPGFAVDAPTIGSDLLTLVHSLSHRVIRQAAFIAGIDRNSLSELLVPSHLGFFVYAAARGGFVLGGLQAVFETELDRLLAAIAHGEHRCPLDPGCSTAGGACVACLHLGEPSCRYFNGFLDRQSLFARDGWFSRSLSAARPGHIEAGSVAQ